MNNINPKTGIAYDTSPAAKDVVTKPVETKEVKVDKAKEPVDARTEMEFLQEINSRLKNAQVVGQPTSLSQVIDVIDVRIQKASSGNIGTGKTDKK